MQKATQGLEKSVDSEERSDGQLLRLGRAGNEVAFLTLYHRYKGSIFRFALHMSGKREIAEEALQEAFLALLADCLKYDEERGSVEAFLIGAARNQVRRQLREVGRFESLENAAELEQPVKTLAAQSEVDALRQAILSLPESYRAVTVLCELEELSYAEAAERLGCALGTVRSRLHRARALLQAKLRRRGRCPMTKSD